MAKYGSTLAEVKVYINGKEQAKKELEELKKTAKEYSDQMTLANNQMLEAAENMAKARERANEAAATKGVDSAEYKQAVDDELRAQQAHDEAQKRHKENQTEYRKYQKLIKETEKLNVELEEAMGRLSEQDIKHLRLLQRQLEAIRNQIDPQKDKDGTFLAYVNNALKQVTDTIKNRRGELLEFEDIMGKLTHVDDRSLESVIKRLKDLIANTDKLDTERLKKFNDQLAQAESEQQRRIGTRAENVMYNVERGTFKGTITETQEAIKLLEEYKKSLKATDVSGIERVQNAIKQMNAELETASREFAAKVMDSPFSFSTEEIEEAIKITQKLQATTKDVDQYNEYARQISEARRAQQEFVDGAKFDAMSEQLKLLPGLSEKALQEQQKYWQAMIEGASKTDAALTTYRENLQKTMDEERRRLQDSLKSTQSEQMLRGGDVKKSVGDIKELIKDYERLESLTDATDAAGLKEIRDVIANLRQQLKQAEAGFLSFDDALAKAKTIAGGTFDGTLEDLAKIKKSIEEGINTKLNLSDPDDIDRLKEAQKLLEDIAKEQREAAQARLADQAKATQDAVEKGTYKGTIEETEKAIELQKQYMKLLDDTDAAGVKKVEDTIEALQNRLKQAKDELMDYSTAMKQVEQIQRGTWKGTLEDLDKIKKSLEYHKQNKLQIGADSDDLKEVNKALNEIDKAAKGVNMSMSEVEALLKDLDSASMEDLEKAARRLQEELHDAARGTEDYAKAAAKLREVNAELKKAKKEWEGQENVIVKTTKRLMAYVAVYGGFNEILGKMKEVMQLNLQLSDSLADVQKTTGLTGVELQELGRSLERIDTRTATTELYNLAAAAGQIGLKTQEDVLGFAKAANTISVALNELGAEGSVSLMKIATLTGEVGRYGTEDALLKVGSAINELTANSAATAGPIADFISRVGGIASASKMAISDMAALGAAADASGQSIEIAGTSMNKLISALVSNTENIAYAANVSVTELQSLIDQGETMQAVIRIFEAMQNMDRGGLNELMKELGSEGARMNQYVASMVANLDLLKRQLNISREAFDENVSVINEYNVKQESALGILQRMKNAFLDTFVNSKMTVVLKDILEYIAEIPDNLAKIPGLLLTIKIIIAELLMFKLPFLLHNLMLQLSGLYRLLAGPMLSALNVLRHAWRQAELELVFGGKAVNGLTIAFRMLFNVVKAHPFAVLFGVITAGLTVWYHFKNQVDEVTKAMAELDEKHARQIEELTALRAALDSTNASYATRAAAMREINSLYSKYLGYELSELDVYGKKSKALDYINAKLRENQALEQENRQREVYSEGFGKESKDELETIREVFQEIPEITATRVPEAMEIMNEAIKKGAKDYTEIMTALSEYFQSDKIPHYSSFFENKDEFNEYIRLYTQYQTDLANVDKGFANLRNQLQNKSNQELWELNKDQYERIQALQNDNSKRTEEEQRAHLKTLLKEQEEYLKTSEMLFEAAKAQDLTNIQNSKGEDDMFDVEALRKNVSEATAVRAEGMNKLKEQQQELKQSFEQALSDVKDYEARLAEARANGAGESEIAALEEELKKKEELRDKADKAIQQNEAEWQSNWLAMHSKNASEVRLQWLEVVQSTKSAIEEIKAAIDGDPFGKLLNLKSWKGFDELINPTALKNTNASSIVNVYKKLREDYLQMSGDLKGLNEMFDFKVPITSLDQAQQQIFSWAEQLRNELRRRGLTTTGMMIAPDAKSQVDNALDKLKTHFVKRQNEIREAFINGSISSAEMNRRIAANDEELLKARVELRKRLNGEASYFNQALYPELKDVDIQRIVASIGVADTEIRTALEEALEEDKNTITEGAVKIREAIEKELMAGDPFATLRDNFRNTLDELELLSSEFERDLASSLQSIYKNLDDVDSPFRIAGLDEETQRERLDFLMELSQKSYTIDRDGLREMFASHEEYYNWVTNLDDQQMDVMLAKLQWFYDESLIKQANYRDRILKGLESSYLQQEEKMNDVPKLEWKIAEAKSDRDNLQAQNDAYDQSPIVSRISQETYDSNVEKIKSYNQAIKKLEEELLDEQEKAANKNKSFRNKKERETKEQMEASISALQAYYNEMEAMIRKRGLERNLTEEEIERQIVENTVARQKDMVQLRKKLLGDESSFDPNANGGYKGAITGTVFFGENKTEEMLQTQANQINVWGKALMDGMRNQIAKSEIEIQKEAQKLRESIQKILLDKQYVQQAVNEMRESFGQIDFINEETKEKLNFLWGNTEQTARTENAAKERMKVLQSFSEDVYSEETETFKKRLLQDATFGETVKSMDEEQYAAFLLLLQQYHDKVISAEKRHADERKRIIDQQWEDEGYQNGYDAAERTIGIAEENLNTMQNAGAIASEQEYFDQYQQLVLNRVALEQWAYEQKLELYKKNNATQEQFQQLDLEHAQKQQNFQQQLLNNYIARYQKMADITTSYGNIIGDGFGRMLAGEEDAGKQLIKNLLTETIQMASQFAQRLILQSTFGAQMESIRATQNAAQLSAAYATAMSEVGIEASKMAAIEAIAAGEITAQSMSQPDSIVTWGAAGAARAAVIIGLVAAATAAALALVNSLFPESKASETKNRKLSTGMLTYAEGNYPVLGNDGKVYDAKYEGAGMKTGIYGGGAHFGIFSEKQPEMIVDGKTTQKLILNYPYIYDAITTIAKNGRLVNAMPTFASGDYPAGMNRIAQVKAVDISGGSNEDMIQMRATMEETREVNRQLLKLLQGGITAHLDGLETHRQQKKNERFLKRRGID